MALKLSFPFPIFAPPHAPVQNQPRNRSPTEIRVSRWNNAGKFTHHKRAAPELEDETRSNRRSDAGAETSGDASASREASRSPGTRPGPSGRKSRFSRNPNLSKLNSVSHQAFRRQRPARLDGEDLAGGKASISVSDSGVSYVVEGAPFEFKYSYTETPKVRPLRLREASFTPFGPATVPRPWTGQKPLPPSKKKAREFDSFKLPPPGKKGVKPVQAPGPFLQESGPRYTRSREEIMGEPLTREEIKQMVDSCIRTRRQLNMGRDGLTHNMLENIHALWKRRRICKIRCMGVCTVDMDNVCQQLEEKTGGKIIQRSGGTLYLFRGRNYNYITRPRYPLMLWKPAAPLYPKLIKRIPEGLTLEEVTEMRKKGSKLIPISKLAKNGAYYDLVNNVREAFEECELIRINCQGLNKSDFHKIGAKLQDLVPCVLISFEEEHILVWRGQNWKSSFPEPEVDLKVANISSFDGVTSISPPSEAEELSSSHISTVSVKDASPKDLNASIPVMNLRDVSLEGIDGPISTEVDRPHAATDAVAIVGKTPLCETISDNTLCNKDQPTALTNASERATIFTSTGSGDEESVAVSNTNVYDSILDNTDSAGDDPAIALAEAATVSDIVGSSSYMLESSIAGHVNNDKMRDISEALQDLNQSGKSSTACTNGILRLWRQALDGGSAVVLDDANLDADFVFKKAVAFAQVAPPGPVFKHVGPKKVKVDVQDGEKKETGDSEVKEIVVASHKKRPDKKSSKLQRKKDSDDRYLDVVTQGSLAVDELAKLLA